MCRVGVTTRVWVCHTSPHAIYFARLIARLALHPPFSLPVSASRGPSSPFFRAALLHYAPRPYIRPHLPFSTAARRRHLFGPPLGRLFTTTRTALPPCVALPRHLSRWLHLQPLSHPSILPEEVWGIVAGSVEPRQRQRQSWGHRIMVVEVPADAAAALGWQLRSPPPRPHSTHMHFHYRHAPTSPLVRRSTHLDWLLLLLQSSSLAVVVPHPPASRHYFSCRHCS
jgi:hypothetical protein